MPRFSVRDLLIGIAIAAVGLAVMVVAMRTVESFVLESAFQASPLVKRLAAAAFAGSFLGGMFLLCMGVFYPLHKFSWITWDLAKPALIMFALFVLYAVVSA